jgi:hypothetical protein
MNSYPPELSATSENILATLIKTFDTNILYFEIDGIKYTLFEIKSDGGNSIYSFLATDAKTWEEHTALLYNGKAIFKIRFEFQQDYLNVDFLTYGLGYTSTYNVLDKNMIYERYDVEGSKDAGTP